MLFNNGRENVFYGFFIKGFNFNDIEMFEEFGGYIVFVIFWWFYGRYYYNVY